MERGRPSSYEPDHARQAQKACELGATDLDIAELIGVDVRTIYRWKHEHQDFCQALTRGKEVADAMVEDRLFRRATGYSHAAVKIFMPAGADEPVYADYTEHHPPDTGAAIFWLKNRKPQEWRDKHDVEHSVDGGFLEVLKLMQGRADGLAPGVDKQPR